MDLITTHINADFDALGSLVAAKKLYPAARLLLPGSPESAVAEFLSLSRELVDVETERECRLDDVDRLILVDTRHRARIGVAETLLDRGVEIHIYDHHPRMKGDIEADRDVYEEVGASVSILADLIRKKRIPLTNLEATIMLLGIYEETGSLTFRSTTRLDVDMVSFLLSKGANLSVVSRYLNRELSEAELSFLTRLIATTERVTVNGVGVSFITLEESHYTVELGVLVHKLMDIENIALLFVFIRTAKGRLDIVSRSRLPEVDLNKLMAKFGGGGHPAAACAKIPDADPAVVRAKLIKLLGGVLGAGASARDVMVTDLHAIGMETRVARAKELLTKEHSGGAPVTDARGRIVGVITRDGVNKALKGGFGHSPVKGYMSPKVPVVSGATPLDDIRAMMLARDAGVILVKDGGRVRGVIRRTDVLRYTHDELFLKHHEAPREIVLNLSKKMTKLMPRAVLELLQSIGSLAEEAGAAAFLVGGTVRDILLGARNFDLDIVVEGDAIALGRALSRARRAALVVHKRFGTCTVVLPHDPRLVAGPDEPRLKIDIATARKEVYERPAALPTVEFSSLKDDLIRRDFTINAMALSINRKSFGQLIDFFNGQDDLARGRIHVLHGASFIDDPTRIFRAVRFEQRFGFAIDGYTGGLIKHAMKEEMFEKVEPQRLRDELILILKEPEPERALRRMDELHELRFLHRKIRPDRDLYRQFGAVGTACEWYELSPGRRRALERWIVYLMALFEPLSYNDVSRICQTYVFKRGDCLRLLSYKKSAQKILTALGSRAVTAPSAVYRLLEPLAFETILGIMARASLLPPGAALRTAERIRAFLEAHNSVRIALRGDDLKAMGLKPGPAFKRILAKVLYAKIDGKLATKDDEIAFAGKLARRIVH